MHGSKHQNLRHKVSTKITSCAIRFVCTEHMQKVKISYKFFHEISFYELHEKFLSHFVFLLYIKNVTTILD